MSDTSYSIFSFIQSDQSTRKSRPCLTGHPVIYIINIGRLAWGKEGRQSRYEYKIVCLNKKKNQF